VTDPTATARAFAALINRHDVTGLVRLMTSDHRLLDAGGTVVTGTHRLEAAWRAYLRMIPDYAIVIDRTLADGETVVLLGSAGGTYVPDAPGGAGGAWRVPAAWRAVVRAGLVAEWQVYADNEPLRALMQSGSGAAPDSGAPP
jgi:ketosteroid isomerase-like protein